jgi:hypothetical protein
MQPTHRTTVRATGTKEEQEVEDMDSMSIAPRVLATSGLFVCDDVRTSTGSWIPTGVVTADLRVTFQGTGLPFAASPRHNQGTSTGISTTGPPV